MSLDPNTTAFSQYLKENSHQLVTIHQIGNTTVIFPAQMDKFYSKTEIFIDALMTSKRVDLTSFEGEMFDNKLIEKINIAFHEAIMLLASKRHLIPYIEGLR